MRLNIEKQIILRSVCPVHKRKYLLKLLQFWNIRYLTDLLMLLALICSSSHQGSSYVRVCVDHFSRFVVLALFSNKFATTVAYALVSNRIYPYTSPRVFSMIIKHYLRTKFFLTFANNVKLLYIILQLTSLSKKPTGQF